MTSVMINVHQEWSILSNGDDGICIDSIRFRNCLDIIGLVGAFLEVGGDVAGVTNATKDHTLVRKSSVTTGNALW